MTSCFPQGFDQQPRPAGAVPHATLEVGNGQRHLRDGPSLCASGPNEAQGSMCTKGIRPERALYKYHIWATPLDSRKIGVLFTSDLY